MSNDDYDMLDLYSDLIGEDDVREGKLDIIQDLKEDEIRERELDLRETIKDMKEEYQLLSMNQNPTEEEIKDLDDLYELLTTVENSLG